MIRRVDCLGCEFDEVLLDEAVTEAVDEHVDGCDATVRVADVDTVVVDCLECGFDATESGRDAALDALSTHESDTGHELELRRRETLGDDVEPGEALTDGGIAEHYWVECRFCGKETVAFERFCRHCDADRQQHRPVSERDEVRTDGGRSVDDLESSRIVVDARNWGSREQIASLSDELDTVFSRHNELVRARPDMVVALFINMADGLRDKFNLDHEVDVLGDDHVAIFVEGDGAAGLLGFVRDDDGSVDTSHIPDSVDLGGGSR